MREHPAGRLAGKVVIGRADGAAGKPVDEYSMTSEGLAVHLRTRTD
jgi:hypothetical protein